MDDYVEDLELLQQYDLGHEINESESDASGLGESRSSGARNDDNDDNDDGLDEQVDLDAAVAEIRTIVVEVVSALGGLEEQQTSEGFIESVYVVGDDCLSE